MKQIKTVTIDPAVWGNGNHKTFASCLLGIDGRGRRRQCCVGIACTALGIPDEVIKDKPTAWKLHYEGVKLPKAIEILAFKEDGPNEPDIYEINDSSERKYRNHAARVKAINNDLAKHEIPLRFKLKGRAK